MQDDPSGFIGGGGIFGGQLTWGGARGPCALTNAHGVCIQYTAMSYWSLGVTFGASPLPVDFGYSMSIGTDEWFLQSPIDSNKQALYQLSKPGLPDTVRTVFQEYLNSKGIDY